MGYLRNITKNEFFMGGLTLLILLNIGNVLNYVFHFSMARMLGPVDYGILAVLTNLIYIFSVPTTSIQTFVSKYTTKFAVRNESGKIKSMFKNLMKKNFLIALFIFVAFCFISFFLSKQLDISIFLLIITGTFLFIAFTYPIAMGILQGMKKFKIWGWNFIFNSIIKLIISIVLVFIGFKVYGAIIGFVVGTALAVLIVIPSIKLIIYSNEKEEKIKIFSKQSLSTLLGIFIITLMYSIDVILARGFFSKEIAGKYAVISTIGKMIFFATATIGNAMFPISSEKFEKGDKTHGTFRKTMSIVFLLCFFSIIAFLIFPNLIIKILFGSQYISMSGILIYVGISFSFLSLLNILILYKISVDNFNLKHVFLLTAFFVLEILALALFKANITEFSIAFMFSSIISFIGGLILIKK